MGIFNWKSYEEPGKLEKHFVIDATSQQLMEAMDARLLRQVVDELTAKVVETIYPEVVKALDKELIVKEVSTRVSDEVIQKLFARPETKKEA